MTIKNFRIIIFTALVMFIITGYAQFTSRYSNWVGFDIGGPFHHDSKWYYDLMNQARIPTDPTRLEQYFFRPSLYYQFDNSWLFWLGYDLISDNPNNDASSIEQRLWPQIEYDKQLLKHIAISLRSRLENRWMSNQAGLAIRFRQRFEFSVINWNKYNVNFDVFDEVFLGVQKPHWVIDRTLDQNRVFIGFIIPLNKRLSIEAGYLNIFRPRTPKNQVEHVLIFALAVNFDGRPAIHTRAI